jgi:hypothetical protein
MVLCTERTTGGHGQTVNRLEYMSGEGQRVYIFTHERLEGEKQNAVYQG